MTCEETKSSIEQAFSLSNGFTFLKSLKNILCVAEKQELNGAELISLAGKGSLYVTMKSIISTDTAHSADSARIYLIPPSMTDSSLTSISSSHSQMSNAMNSDSFVSLSASSSNQSLSPHCGYTRSAFMQKADIGKTTGNYDYWFLETSLNAVCCYLRIQYYRESNIC